MVYFLCKAYDSDRQNCYFAQSLPVRGAWIEIPALRASARRQVRRSPCGERGLKYKVKCSMIITLGRSPCGERGLKLQDIVDISQEGTVAPRAGSVD